MKTYLKTTGTLFIAIPAAHLWRMVSEPQVASDPWYIALTVVAAVLGGWAWRLHRSLAPS